MSHQRSTSQRSDDSSVQYELPDILNKITERCIARGVTGFKEFSRMFRLYDQDSNRQLNAQELTVGLRHYGCNLSTGDIKVLIEEFDRDGSGLIDMNEFIRVIRPTMRPCRVKIVEQAFNKMDITGDNRITFHDLNDSYSVTNHPKFKSGEWTKQQCFVSFLKSFQVDEKTADDTITKDEFMDYYTGLSASIDQDVYFDFMIRQSWKL